MDIFVSVLLPLVVVVIMFSLGVGLEIDDFRRIGRRPRAACVGALNQIVLLPLVAYVTILLFGFRQETAVGLMILAACPGGAASNIITKLARWDVALSVTLTATFSLTCIVTIPLVLNFAMVSFMGDTAPDIEISSTALMAFVLTALPISAGMLLRAIAPGTTAALELTLARLALVLFVAVIGAAIASNWHVVTDNISQLGLGLVAMVAALTAIGLYSARLLGTTDGEAKTIAVETGVQNGALGLAIASILVPESPTFNLYSIPIALYGVIWLGTGLPTFLFLAWKR